MNVPRRGTPKKVSDISQQLAESCQLNAASCYRNSANSTQLAATVVTSAKNKYLQTIKKNSDFDEVL